MWHGFSFNLYGSRKFHSSITNSIQVIQSSSCMGVIMTIAHKVHTRICSHTHKNLDYTLIMPTKPLPKQLFETYMYIVRFCCWMLQNAK